MTAVKDTTPLMQISAYPEDLVIAEHTFSPVEASKGFMTLTLKKAGATLSEKKIPLVSLSPGQPVLKLAIGAQGAAGDDSATKLSWNLVEGDTYSVEFQVSGKVNFAVGSMGTFAGNGHGALTITGPAQGGNNLVGSEG